MNVTSVSAVIPTYNDADHIGETLSSVISQSRQPDEIVVADDGSTDSTREIVLELARHSSVSINYVRLASRRGVVEARNTGIEQAKGEWIANCDSDDLWLPHKLEHQISFISAWKGEPLAILGTYGYNINDDGHVLSPVTMGPTSEAEYVAIKERGGLFYLIHASIMFPKGIYEAAGGYTTEYGAAEDCDFWTRMSDLGVVLALTEPLVHYRKRLASTQLTRFSNNRDGLERLAINRRRQILNQDALTSEDFERQQAAAPFRHRLRRRRLTLGAYYYRLGAARVVSGHRLRGAVNLVMAGSLDWHLVGAGIKSAARHQIAIARRHS